MEVSEAPSKRDIKKEITERLEGQHKIPTPLAARRHDEIEWGGDFYISVVDVEVYELHKRRKWLPTKWFDGKTTIEFKFHERTAPSESKLYDSFLGRNPHYEVMNKHIDDPYCLDVRFDVADPDVICGRLFNVLKQTILEIKFKEDNPDVDEDWLLHQQNTILGYKDGNLYDIMNERVALHLLHQKGAEIPDNIPRKSD